MIVRHKIILNQTLSIHIPYQFYNVLGSFEYTKIHPNHEHCEASYQNTPRPGSIVRHHTLDGMHFGIMSSGQLSSLVFRIKPLHLFLVSQKHLQRVFFSKNGEKYITGSSTDTIHNPLYAYPCLISST